MLNEYLVKTHMHTKKEPALKNDANLGGAQKWFQSKTGRFGQIFVTFLENHNFQILALP